MAALYSRPCSCNLTVAHYTDTARTTHLATPLSSTMSAKSYRATPQVGSHRPFTAEARFRYTICEIRGVKCDLGRVLPPNDSVFPYYYNSETPPYSHSVYQPTNTLNTTQQNTNHKTQFIQSIKLLHVLKVPVRATSV
jgi:hypothetical protein